MTRFAMPHLRASTEKLRRPRGILGGSLTLGLMLTVALFGPTAPASAAPSGSTSTGSASSGSASSGGSTGDETTGLYLEIKTNGQVYGELPNWFGAIGALVKAGSPVTWTYEVTNYGNSDVSGVKVTDKGTGNAAPSVTCPATIAAGATAQCQAAGTAIAGQYQNTATATATSTATSSSNAVAVASNEASSWYFGTVSGFTLEKRVNGTHQTAAPGLKVSEGDKVTWTYKMTNTGNYPVEDAMVEDSGTDGPVNVKCPARDDDQLAGGDSITCTAETTAIKGQYTNTATAMAEDPVAGVVYAYDSSWYFSSDDSTPEPTPTPTPTPEPTPTPTPEPTPTPTPTPSPEPTDATSPAPTDDPTGDPTSETTSGFSTNPSVDPSTSVGGGDAPGMDRTNAGSSDGALPSTGASVTWALLLGLLALGTGVTVLVTRRHNAH